MSSRTLSTYPITYLNGLGLVASGKREINTGNQFDKYYPIRNPQEVTLGRGNSYDTLQFMVQKIQNDHKEATKIATKLYHPNLAQFTKNIFDHIFHNFQYKPDPRNREQVKGVAGSYARRKSGIDCDDMAFLIGTILYNKGIPFALRKISNNASGDFTHVYVVVPKRPGLPLNRRENYYVIDPVVDTFDFEYPKNRVPKYYDEVLVNKKLSTMKGFECDSCTMQGIEDKYKLDTKQGWVQVKENVISGAEPIPTDDTKEEFLNKVNALISSWDDPETREYIIAILLVDELEEEDGLAGMEGLFKRVFKGVKKGVSTVAKTAGKVVKGAVKVTSRVNPTTTLAREGIKAYFRLAGKKNAAKVWPGAYTEAQARAVGISSAEWRKRNEKWESIKKLFTTIGGTTDKLRDAIFDGAKKEAGSQKWFIDKSVVESRKTPGTTSRVSPAPPRVTGPTQSRVSPAPPRVTGPTNSRDLSTYNRYMILYNRYKTSNPSLANRYVPMINNLAPKVGKPTVATIGASSNTANSTSTNSINVSPNVLSYYNRYMTLYNRYKTSNPSLANRYVPMINNLAPKVGKPTVATIGSSAPANTSTKANTTSTSNSKYLALYNRYLGLYNRYKTSNPSTANRYVATINRYASLINKPTVSPVGTTSSRSATSRISTPTTRTAFGIRRNPSIATPTMLRTALRGFELTGMGVEPISTGAAAAAATPFIVKIINLLKGISDSPVTAEVVRSSFTKSSSGTKPPIFSNLKSRLEEIKKSQAANLLQSFRSSSTLPQILKDAAKSQAVKNSPKTTSPLELTRPERPTNATVQELEKAKDLSIVSTTEEASITPGISNKNLLIGAGVVTVAAIAYGMAGKGKGMKGVGTTSPAKKTTIVI